MSQLYFSFDGLIHNFRLNFAAFGSFFLCGSVILESCNLFLTAIKLFKWVTRGIHDITSVLHIFSLSVDMTSQYRS